MPLALLLLAGCASRRAGDALGSVDFVFEGERGDKRVQGSFTRPNKRAMRNTMSHPAPRWQSFLVPGLVEPTWLARDQLDSDVYRIEIYFANQGYFDARFLGWELRRESPAGKPVQRLRAIGHVAEGEPSLLAEDVVFVGIDKMGAPLQRRVRSMAVLEKGDIFTLEGYEATLRSVRGTLLDRSYAYAKVTGNVQVRADEHLVDIQVAVISGPASRFGAITIEGLEKVPEPIVRELLDVEEGEPFSASAIARTRAKLYALHVFGVVDIVPDLSDPTSSTVPVRIQVKEAKFRELRAGPVFEAETGKIALMAQANYKDQNVGGRLWRTEQETRVGVGAIVENIQALPALRPADLKPVLDVKGLAELPHLFGGDWSQVNEGRVEVGLEPAYSYFAASFAPTVAYTGFEKLRLSLGYRIRYFDYFDYEEGSLDAIEDSPLGRDLTDPYLLSMLEQRVVYDGRNDPVNTTRGWYWSAALAEAGVFDEGDFSFFRAVAEVRAYRGILSIFGWDPDTVVAGRLGGGIIIPYGSADTGAKPVAPYAELLYLGGSNTVRGWAANRLGPWIDVPCEDAHEFPLPDLPADFPPLELPHACSTLEHQLPAGGNLQLFGNFEIRKGLPLGLTGVLFVDAGRVWDRVDKFNFSEIQVSVGGGVRYGTPVGPIRLDVGFRLSDPEYFDGHPRPTVHLSLAEAF
ncbi:MAG: BamA/TamA family outer membrane protein [Pseudomonadota bacterium]|nr:BamA/TamA family outer membrane protein [Pseudomonadota bacterium]